MLKLTVKLAFLLILITAAAMATDMEVVDRVVAIVDNEIIMESEVIQFAQDIALRDRASYKTEEDFLNLKSQVLEELIVQKIMLAAAHKDTNIVIDDREVNQVLDERLNSIVEQLGGEEELAEYYGKPIRQIRRDYRKQVADGIYIDRLRSSKLMGVTVSRPEVVDFYEAHKDEFPILPEQARPAHILIPIEPTQEAQDMANARADSLFSLLESGIEFAQVALQNSDDTGSGANGGLLGTTERGDLVPEFEEIAFGLEEGGVSQPVLSRFGYHIIRLNWRRGEKINTSHVLVSLKPSPADEERALVTCSDLRDRALAGEDFADLAIEYSDDSESAKLGGDLGFFEVPNMPDEFRLVSRDLAVGEISEPFRTKLGVHIVKMLDRQDERSFNLEQDWVRINRIAQNDKQDRVYKEWVEEIGKEVYVERK